MYTGHNNILRMYVCMYVYAGRQAASGDRVALEWRGRTKWLWTPHARPYSGWHSPSRISAGQNTASQKFWSARIQPQRIRL